MSVDVRFSPATAADVRAIVPRMREDDRREVVALGETVETAVLLAVTLSAGDAWLVTFDGEPAAIFGVVPCSLLMGHAVPWLLTTPVIDRFPKTFYKVSRTVLAQLRERYSLLGNMIDVRYKKSLRWARRLGFTVKDPKPQGPHGALFCEVVMGGVE